MNINQYIIKQLYQKVSLKKSFSSEYLSRLKRKASREYGLPCPTNIEILETYRQMIKSKKIKPDREIENILITKNIRTLSGVAVIAVLTKPYPCPGTCKFCPNEKDMPKSYLSNEPAVMRAILTGFHPYKQVQARLKSLEATGHKTDKIELIVMGGTFSYLPRQYQTWFIKKCFKACNKNKNQDSPPDKGGWGVRKNISRSSNLSLEQLQKQNEKSSHRIVGLTLETRPDYINEKEILRMRKLGATRVELGVQSIYDDILELNKRGHSVTETIKATKLLKEAGFKINYHLMPDLPGSNYKKDLTMFKELFSNQDFQPDMLKIYPCVVVKNAPIYKWLKTGKYKPYSDKKLIQLLCEIKKIIPYYVRITRLIRDIPSTSIVAGNKVSNLRQVLKKKSEEEGWQCKCIRCREARDQNIPPDKEGWGVGKLKLFRQDYNASDGKEIFLSFEDKKRRNIYSLLRLRINSQDYNFYPALAEDSCGFSRPSKNSLIIKKIPILQNASIIREVHTYGKLVPIKSKNKKSPQHTGLGKKLIAEAEKITIREFNLKKIAVISGIGVRDYYRKLDYKLEDGYMVKYFK
ncbi:MAG: tRNA uridine(34) 5-carboxymethylaminomethyl modification radical SAM/GNAT enzyme Elp3 [Candidatus Pacebacteria bacterium]|nr:tRNA uridine(34) 5-carboxymethylaminomethyl modification radical SAM/GNAT enzyme Elp3 [Candidatus Paceibacterota bacterium]